MPSECSVCLTLHSNEQIICAKCNHHCHVWTGTSLVRPSTLAKPALNSPKASLFLSGLKNNVHRKKAKSDKTQKAYKGGIKTARQQLTLDRGLRNIKAGKSTVVSEYGNGGALVQIHMVLSSKPLGRPSFYGVKRDGSVHPRAPNDPLIPEQFRDDVEDYDSSDDDTP